MLEIKSGAKLLIAAVAATALMILVPSAAGAAACTNNILCDNAGTALRDDATTPPTGGGYGAAALATNTEGALRLLAVVPGTEEVVAANENPANYAYFGVQLERNPATGCAAGEEAATGSVTFADIQNAAPSAVFAGISPGGLGPWSISVRSDKCATEPGRITVTGVDLLFPGLNNVVATGTFSGTYVQPNAATCEGGGMELDLKQPGVTVAGVLTARIDNGKGQPAFLCFVSGNNYLFPSEAPQWEPLTGAIWKD